MVSLKIKNAVLTMYVTIINLCALAVAVVAGFFITLENEYYGRRVEFLGSWDLLLPHTSFYWIAIVGLLLIAIYEIFSFYWIDGLKKNKTWAKEFLAWLFVFAIAATIFWGLFIVYLEDTFNVTTWFEGTYVIFASCVMLGSILLLLVYKDDIFTDHSFRTSLKNYEHKK